MEYRRLGRTGLKVSQLCLGSMQFGWTCDEAVSCAIMDAYREAGGTFLDTANNYSRWVAGNPGGVAERIIGRWMKSRGCRDSMVIATKVRAPIGEGANDQGLSRRHIMQAVEGSLQRLQIDYIDLYQAHWDDKETPLDETLRAFDDLIRQGKVRYVGASNYSAWRLMHALSESDRHNYARYASLQPHYNLAYRDEFEEELEPLCLEQGLGVIPYSPLANGFLSGKYRPGQSLPGSSRAGVVRRRYLNAWGFALLEKVDEVAMAHGATTAQVAVAWLLARPSITAPIIGANSVEQLCQSLAASRLHLDPTEMKTLDAASAWRTAQDGREPQTRRLGLGRLV